MKSNSKNKTLYIQAKQKEYFGQNVCQNLLDQILNKSFEIHIKKQKINKVIQRQKLKQSTSFSNSSFKEMIQSFFIQPSEFCSQVKQQHISSPKSKYQFFNHGKQQKQQQNRVLKYIQHHQNGHTSARIYNCNRPYIIKRSLNISQERQNDIETQSIKLKDNFFQNKSLSRFKNVSQLKKMTLNSQSTNRLNSRGRLTVNPKYSSNRQSPSMSKTLCEDQFNINKKNYTQKYSRTFNNSTFFNDTSEHSMNPNLIKIQIFQHSKQNNNTKKNRKQENNHEERYINLLRENKSKTQKFMELFKGNQKKQKVISPKQDIKGNKQNQIKNSQIVTDFEGNVLQFSNRKKLSANKNLKKSNCNDNYEKYQPNYEAALKSHVSFKIKNYDQNTKNILSHILSSVNRNPQMQNNTKKQIYCNRETQNYIKVTKKHQEFDFKNISAIESLSKVQFQQESNNLQKLKKQKHFLKQDNNIPKSIKSILKISKKDLKNNKSCRKDQQYCSKNMNEKQNVYSSKIKGNHYLSLKLKDNSQKIKLSSLNSNRKQFSIMDLGNYCFQAYNAKNERVYTARSKKLVTINTQENHPKQMQPSVAQNVPRPSIETHTLNNMFGVLLHCNNK